MLISSVLILISSSLIAVNIWWVFGLSNGNTPVELLEQAELDLTNIAPIPVVTNLPLPELSKPLDQISIYAWDVNSGSNLINHRSTNSIYPASTVKLMTGLVAVNTFEPTQILTVPAIEFVGARIGMFPGWQLTVKELLKATLIQSANDAALTLAWNHPHQLTGFVSDMNLTANQLNLTNTIFTNPTGLDDQNQKSTTRDLTILGNEVSSNPQLQPLISTASAELNLLLPEISSRVTNTNQLLTDPEVNASGIKTGTTELAGQVLISLVEINGYPVIITVAESQDRYQDTKQLINWIQSNVEWVKSEEIVDWLVGDPSSLRL